MLESIRRMLGGSPKGPSSQDSFQQLNAVAPLKPSQNGASKENAQKHSSFICREAILDRNERIAGYEFALGQSVQSRMMDKSAQIRRVYDDAMLNSLAPLGVSSLLGERNAFIRLSVESLQNPHLDALANPNTVVMITPRPLAEIDVAGMRASLAHIKALGFRQGWAINQPRPEYAEFLHQADFIEIDPAQLDGIQLKAMIAELRAANSSQKLIASRLQTADDFKYCFERGFNYFMGPFVSSRENWHPSKSDVNYLRVFQALEMIQSGAEFDAIAECLRTDPILTFKLLRYINSPGIGLLQKIEEIQRALLLLGRDRFYRWLSLLLFDSKKPGYHENVLQEQALTRARFMEMLAGKGRVPANADQLFLTGLFSLMHVMLAQPLEDVLKQVALPEAVVSALRGETSAMHDALTLAISIESGIGSMEADAAQCGVDASEVSGILIDALAWAQQIAAVRD
ncbi:EAL and HDOD domain-containing protein [Sideroxydans lithotrophicus]|uniref:Putative signal transduction protein n=1 Tax=Sideroxydans lithotrophicus (strain ES-1) TaxID=580332 RepID=D5CR76_SIDLE|nr:HDOD domain-containing protein [Sideroxydans lithotrophicus]ADE11462.1 putative signal transduction protein [Sideroxydans lithotrophicus ES-1]